MFAVWAHQTALNTNRFVALVSDTTSDPAVVDSLSEKLATQIATSLDLNGRLANLLPDVADRFVPALADGITRRMDTAISNVLSSPTFHDTWTSLLATAHEKFLAALRGDTPNLQATNGVVTIDLVSLALTALTELQTQGVIPPNITIPTPEPFASHEEQVARINAALGTSLPATFGQIQLAEGQKLQQASAIVQASDAITVGLLIASAILGVVTVWYADKRWRAILAIVLGVTFTMALVMVFLGALSKRAADTVASPDGHVLIAAFVQRLSQSLFLWLMIVVLTALFIGGIFTVLGGRDRGRQKSESSTEAQADS